MGMERVEVEVILAKPVEAWHLEHFAWLGGEVRHRFRSVSSGWLGWIDLDRVPELARGLGGDLALVELPGEAEPHLWVAVQTGRVGAIREGLVPGVEAGLRGRSDLTIGIIDSGVDGSHPDLSGRGVFWKDYTPEAVGFPVDFTQHGTHVASVAVGNGAAGSAAGSVFRGTLSGNLSGVLSNNFIATAVDMPTGQVRFEARSEWVGGGLGRLRLVTRPRGAKVGWVPVGPEAEVVGESPVRLEFTFEPDPARDYAPVLVSNGRMGGHVIVFGIEGWGPADGGGRWMGVAPACRWAAGRVFTAGGNGSLGWTGAALDDLVAERQRLGVRVINVSLGASGAPGLSETLREKVNRAVELGVVVVCSGGNDGLSGSGTAGETDDPGRAANALTVVAASDIGQLTDYSSHGFVQPGRVRGLEEGYKPDLMAPGGSSYQTAILAADSNSGDLGGLVDFQADDYWASQGTSVAAPFVAGSAALVITAMDTAGVGWDFQSADSALRVKAVLCATATESNRNREGFSTHPSLQRAANGPGGYPAGKDGAEGYGLINVDAAVEAVTLGLDPFVTHRAVLGAGPAERRAWARSLGVVEGERVRIGLQVPASGDFDLHVYSGDPGESGEPRMLAASASGGLGLTEHVDLRVAATGRCWVVVKRVAGEGGFALVGGVMRAPEISVEQAGTGLRLRCRTVSGWRYLVEAAGELDGRWELVADVGGEGGDQVVYEDGGGMAARWFRVRIE